MKARQVRTAEDARRLVEERDLTHVKVGAFDADGVLRGKYISRGKFLSALESGFGFCDVVLGWDVEDQPYDNIAFTGWHTGFPDASLRVLPETCRDLPFDENGLLFLGDFTGAASTYCPRSVLARVVERARAMGFEPYCAAEYEFFVFAETPDSVREKGYQNLRPMTPGSFGYSMLRATTGAEFCQELLHLCEKMDIPLEGLHTETGPGVLEAAITVTTAMEAADRAGLFKTFVKAAAQRRGLMATFMAKWSHEQPGQSGHLHLSLKGKDGAPAFYQQGEPANMSETMRHFVAGQQRLLPELLALSAPTVNSYSRLVPGFWAPTNATWGVENRTCALRVIPGSAKSQRVEYRVAGADANPYLAMAAALGSGLLGVENGWEPGAPATGNAYATQWPDSARLPATLWDAAQAFRGSDAARELFGAEFVEHYAASREWEEREFRRHVTDWELKRYFEII